MKSGETFSVVGNGQNVNEVNEARNKGEKLEGDEGGKRRSLKNEDSEVNGEREENGCLEVVKRHLLMREGVALSISRTIYRTSLPEGRKMTQQNKLDLGAGSPSFTPKCEASGKLQLG